MIAITKNDKQNQLKAMDCLRDRIEDIYKKKTS